MTISDATPIQFWINGEETFNQANPICGLTNACFCQPFNCGDEIKIQFQDEESATFFLLVLNSDEEAIHNVEFEEVSPGVYQISFIACENSISGRVSLIIYSGEPNTIIPLDEWVNTYASNPLNVSGDEFSEDVTAGGTYGMDQPLIEQLPVGAEIVFDVVIEISGTWSSGPITIAFRIIRNGGIQSGITTINFNVNQAPTTHTISLTKAFAQIDAEDLSVEISPPAVGTATVVITMPVGGVIYYNTDNVSSQSDCIDIRNNHQCSKLMEYTNSDDFDGIVYNLSPPPTFYLRVPAQLLEDENPQTQEDLELSNGVIVTVRQTIQEKSILKLGFMPPYMHTKVQKVLMHDTVISDGIQWKRRDAYEAPRIEDYPLKKGEVLLTKYNSVLKNTI